MNYHHTNPFEAMDLSGGSSGDYRQLLYNRPNGRGTYSLPPLPVASYSGAVHPFHYLRHSIPQEQASYYSQPPNYDLMFQQQNFGTEVERSEGEVSSSNIFADTYAKAAGLYRHPKMEVQVQSSEEDSTYSEVDFDGSEESPDTVEDISEYAVETGDLSPQPFDNQLGNGWARSNYVVARRTNVLLERSRGHLEGDLFDTVQDRSEYVVERGELSHEPFDNQQGSGSMMSNYVAARRTNDLLERGRGRSGGDLLNTVENRSEYAVDSGELSTELFDNQQGNGSMMSNYAVARRTNDLLERGQGHSGDDLLNTVENRCEYNVDSGELSPEPFDNQQGNGSMLSNFVVARRTNDFLERGRGHSGDDLLDTVEDRSEYTVESGELSQLPFDNQHGSGSMSNYVVARRTNDLLERGRGHVGDDLLDTVEIRSEYTVDRGELSSEPLDNQQGNGSMLSNYVVARRTNDLLERSRGNSGDNLLNTVENSSEYAVERSALSPEPFANPQGNSLTMSNCVVARRTNDLLERGRGNSGDDLLNTVENSSENAVERGELSPQPFDNQQGNGSMLSSYVVARKTNDLLERGRENSGDNLLNTVEDRSEHAVERSAPSPTPFDNQQGNDTTMSDYMVARRTNDLLEKVRGHVGDDPLDTVEDRPEYAVESSALSPKPFDNQQGNGSTMSSYAVARRTNDLLEEGRGHLGDGSYDFDADAECEEDQMPTCRDATCPGNLRPRFQKYVLPKHKTVQRIPNELIHHHPSDAIEGDMTPDQRKLLLRRLKNREAAKRCRKKKKEEFKALLLEQEALLNDVHQLYHDIEQLRKKTSFHSTPTGHSYISI